MADFSQYSGFSDEWLAVAKTLPPSSLDDMIANPKGTRDAINVGLVMAAGEAMAPLRSQIHTFDHAIPVRDGSTIEARSYRSTSIPEDEILPVYLYFHGGGFLIGNLEGDDANCATTAIRTGAIVLHANYRHTPEHSFPTPWLDTQDAFVWLHQQATALKIDPSKVIVGGASAGGILAASLTMEQHLGTSTALSGLPRIAGQVLMIPCMVYPQTYEKTVLPQMKSREISSAFEYEDGPLLPMRMLEFFYTLLKIPSVPSPSDLKLNLLTAATEVDLKGLPPAVFGVAGADPLRDEDLLYAKLLAEAGVATEVRLFWGVPHAFTLFGPSLSAMAHWEKCTEEGIAWALGKPEPSGKFEVKVLGK